MATGSGNVHSLPTNKLLFNFKCKFLSASFVIEAQDHAAYKDLNERSVES